MNFQDQNEMLIEMEHKVSALQERLSAVLEDANLHISESERKIKVSKKSPYFSNLYE